MVVTSITMQRLSPQERGICGEFSIVLDDSLCIHKISVISGDKGLFIAFPNTGEMRRFANSKKYLDIVHPTNNNLRQMIQSEVLKRYEEELAKLSEQNKE